MRRLAWLPTLILVFLALTLGASQQAVSATSDPMWVCRYWPVQGAWELKPGANPFQYKDATVPPGQFYQVNAELRYVLPNQNNPSRDECPVNPDPFPTQSPTPTDNSASPAATPSPTRTVTATATATVSVTQSPTATGSGTPSPTATGSGTPTGSPSPTITLTPPPPGTSWECRYTQIDGEWAPKPGQELTITPAEFEPKTWHKAGADWHYVIEDQQHPSLDQCPPPSEIPGVTPSPTATSSTPTPSPTRTTASPTPTRTTASPTPTRTTASPTPTRTTASPTPTTTTPKPTSATPTPTTPVPSRTPTPTPTPTPTTVAPTTAPPTVTPTTVAPTTAAPTLTAPATTQPPAPETNAPPPPQTTAELKIVLADSTQDSGGGGGGGGGTGAAGVQVVGPNAAVPAGPVEVGVARPNTSSGGANTAALLGAAGAVAVVAGVAWTQLRR